MKFALIISLILGLMSVGILVMFDFAPDNKRESFRIETLVDADPAKQPGVLDELFARGALPRGQETAILQWIFTKENEHGLKLLRDNATTIERLPHHLSETIFAMVKERQGKPVGMALAFSRQFFPNDPEVLAMAGIVAYIAQRPDEARRLLEQAGSWRQPDTRADFYLGGILLQADLTADKARGKSLLMRVAASDNREFSELAALMLLTRADVPMLAQERGQLLERLDELNAFRADSPNLNADVLRLLANGAAAVKPELAVRLIQLVVDAGAATVQDRIGQARLLQSLQRYDEAAAALKAIRDADLAAPETPEAWEVERVETLNNLATGNTEGALERIAALGAAQPDNRLIHELYARALTMDLSIEFQRQLLPPYLQLPPLDPRLTLVVLNRLMEVAPLRKDEWIAYAAETVLPQDTLFAAQWLTMNGGAAALAAAIEAGPEPLSRDQAMALVEARIELGQLDAAQQALAAHRPKLRPVDAAFFQSRIHLLRGDKALAQESWTEAYNAAMGDNAYEALKRLGFLALDLDQPVIGLQSLYAAFTAGISFTPQQSGRLIELTIRYGTIRQSMKVAEHLHTAYPQEPSYTNNYAYFKFLAGEDIDAYVEKMRALVDEYGDILPFRMTLALGLVKAGRNNEAMRLLQSASINLDDLTVQGKLIYAAVLGANGQQLAARGMLQNLDLAGLMPEEKALVESM